MNSMTSPPPIDPGNTASEQPSLPVPPEIKQALGRTKRTKKTAAPTPMPPTRGSQWEPVDGDGPARPVTGFDDTPDGLVVHMGGGDSCDMKDFYAKYRPAATEKLLGESPNVPPPNTPVETVNETPRVGSYPETFDKRELKVPLTGEETHSLVMEMAGNVRVIAHFQEERAASAKSWGARIAERQTRQTVVGSLIEDGFERRSVRCQWHFEAAGRDSATGELIHHPEMKTLVRTDTGEVVEVVRMNLADRQQELNFGKEPITPPEAGDSDPGAIPAPKVADTEDDDGFSEEEE